MAKLTASCCLMGVSKNVGKDGTVYATAQLFFDEDNTSVPVGVDRKNLGLLAQIENMKRVDGQVTVAIREYKGSKFLDLVAFAPKK